MFRKVSKSRNNIYKSFEEPTCKMFNNHLYQKPIIQNNKYKVVIIREEVIVIKKWVPHFY